MSPLTHKQMPTWPCPPPGARGWMEERRNYARFFFYIRDFIEINFDMTSPTFCFRAALSIRHDAPEPRTRKV